VLDDDDVEDDDDEAEPDEPDACPEIAWLSLTFFSALESSPPQATAATMTAATSSSGSRRSLVRMVRSWCMNQFTLLTSTVHPVPARVE
jgi:hypothetical protein